jgi:hypothetical protein
MATDLVMVPRLLITLSAGLLLAASAEPHVAVTENAGLFNVSASFAVSQPAEVVMAVLTDFERIPHYMPDMEISKVIKRTPGSFVVEQQAVSKFMLFSKRVHLLLDVREDNGLLRFSDHCGKSFSVYTGSWMVAEHDSLTVIDYQLSARPTFDVPAFVLKRLLKRDSTELIDRIKAEITQRADRRK